MIFDIRTSEYAVQTLTTLTRVPTQIWETYVGREREYECTDALVEEVISEHGELPDSINNFVFVYFHITTSANQCASIRKYGVLDLKKAYSCQSSELRKFLDQHEIYINLEKAELEYRGQLFKIPYGICPRTNTIEERCWAVGRKFYFDFTTCGFLSVSKRSPYGGQVHWRPEILANIDNLLNTKLSYEWATTHKAYEVTSKVLGEDIVYAGYDEQSEKGKVLNYLTMAYWNAFGEPTENILLIKNDVQIPPNNILSIEPLQYWR